MNCGCDLCCGRPVAPVMLPCPTTATITAGGLDFPVTDELELNGVDYLLATPERRAAGQMLQSLETVMGNLRRRKGTDQEGRLPIADILAIEAAIGAARGEATSDGDVEG